MTGEALAIACGILDAVGLGPSAMRALFRAVASAATPDTGAECFADGRGWALRFSEQGSPATAGDALQRMLASPDPPPAVVLHAATDRGALRLRDGWSLARAAARSERASALARRVNALGVASVSLADAHYPPSLRSIAQPPALLFLRGPLDPGAGVVISVVGSRRASAYGRRMATRLAWELAEAGVAVASGLARGIDGTAHRAVLDAGGGTIAVLGTGPDVCYPAEHLELAEDIARAGALVTEYLPGTPPRPGHFPARNRILSGLARAVVVVEAGERSGALGTARLALNEGREVCAVPGDVTAPGSAGPHALLRDGAALVETAADILAACGLSRRVGGRVSVAAPALLGGALGRVAQERGTLATSEAVARCAADAHAAHEVSVPQDGHASGPLPPELAPHLGFRPRTLDDLVDATGLPASHLGAALERLVLAGALDRDAGGGYLVAADAHRGKTRGI